MTPTIHGNLLIGPTAADVTDKDAVNTTQEGLDILSEKAALSVKDLPMRQVITSFAGLRAHESGGDFVIGEAPNARGFINACRASNLPGLSSPPPRSESLRHGLPQIFSPCKKRRTLSLNAKSCVPATLSMEERNRLIKENPAYGNISLCRCEMISEGEIIDAIHRPLGARFLRRHKTPHARRHGTLPVGLLFAAHHADPGARDSYADV